MMKLHPLQWHELRRGQDGPVSSRAQWLEYGLDFGVDGDVGLGEAVNLVAGTRGVAEVEEAADVVVLVEDVEDSFGLLARKAKCGDGNGFAVAAGGGKIFFEEIAQRHGQIQT